MRVLLAVDASRDSRTAARMITHLAEPPDLDILYVVDIEALKHTYISPVLPPGYYETYRKEIAEAAEHVLHEMKAELAPYADRIRLIADTGDAAESIVETAAESGVSLVILGQRGMTATPTILLGGVSQKVATYAPCAVLVVKEAIRALDRIVLAVDGSADSNKAMQFLARCPFRGPIRVTVITVWPRQRMELSGLSLEPSERADLKELVKSKGEELLRSVAAAASEAPYEIETEWLQGDPASSILDAAVRYEAQMIVLGSRGMKAMKRFLLGSVSQKVLVHSTCSVLIVH